MGGISNISLKQEGRCSLKMSFYFIKMQMYAASYFEI